MSTELNQQTLRDEFNRIREEQDPVSLRTFLDDQNISDIAEWLDDETELATEIIASMSMHRAVSVFKILDLSLQKQVIRELLPSITANLLNELPADDRTDFLEELPSNVVRELIKLLEPEERKITL